ncbi:MAG: DEAD/DEAH box helicase, partial [Saprospiraceae bacterium]|nr:DEAD/DEAH box helicase [Saprospiraceae bacterium]
MSPESDKTRIIKSILRENWGYSEFREGQEQTILSVIDGKDTLAVLPTGTGKSVCYQVPGLYFDKLTIVISPLIALMEDQVRGLKARGIPALALTSAHSRHQQDILMDNIVYGNYNFFFISPERIRSSLFRSRIIKTDPGLIVIDEAHCISEWGHDFRPEYRQISELRELLP